MSSRVKNVRKRLLSDDWYTLNKYSYEFQTADGKWETQSREAYDRGNGATILLYNRDLGTVILTRQFRLPTYINGNTDGFMIESCAGLLDNDNARDCIVKETEEETGYRIDNPRKILEAYMSPGSVTEKLHFFVAEYRKQDKVSEGGGLEHEQENIEVLELSFSDALEMIQSGSIQDGKTIMLLQYAKLQGLLAS